MKYRITRDSVLSFLGKLDGEQYKKICNYDKVEFENQGELLNFLEKVLPCEQYTSYALEICKACEVKECRFHLPLNIRKDHLVFNTFFLVTVVYVITFIVLVVWNSIVEKDGVISPASFGDSFGALNTLFSGFAFAGLLIALYYQRVELKNNKIELQLNREELRHTRKEFSEQNKVLKKDSFEATFFKLMSLHNEIVDSLQCKDGNGNALLRRDCFPFFKSELRLGMIITSQGRDGIKRTLDRVDKYDMSYREIAPYVEHYHKNLYQTFKFVHNAPGGVGIDKKTYSNIIRSQLSRSELELLFYHCLSEYGVEKFKPLVEKYEIFEHLPQETKYLKKDIRRYSPSAYGANPALQKMYEEVEG